MSSILTNVASQAALQTLRALDSHATKTQSEVSTGLRVYTAADNSAYWSISTTMRSDMQSMSAAADAMGIGQATVDTAYSGLDATVEMLSEIKARVVAAAEDGVDRKALQGEIEQLKQQIVAIAASSSFSGQNWLSTDIPNLYADGASKSVVSGFVRDNDGSVKVTKIDVPLLGTALFNSTGGGILQADDRGVGDIGGLRGVSLVATGSSRSAGFVFDGPLIFADDTTAVTFEITLDGDDIANTPNPQPGTTLSVTINRSLVDQLYPGNGGVVNSIDEWSNILETAIGKTEIYIPYNTGNLGYSLNTRENLGRGASVFITNVASTLASGGTGGIQEMAAPVYGSRPQKFFSGFTSTFTLHSSNAIDIPLTVNGVTTTARITRDLVDAALGTNTGTVATRDDFIAVLNLAFSSAGIIASPTGAAAITFSLDSTLHPESGRKSSFRIGPARDLVGTDIVSADLMSLDIAGKTADILKALSDVEVMFDRVTAAAARVGGVAKRLEIQEDLTSRLMDSVDSGIGRLVDADMEDAGTKMKAIQAQKQLALDSLVIANQAPSVIATLFG